MRRLGSRRASGRLVACVLCWAPLAASQSPVSDDDLPGQDVLDAPRAAETPQPEVDVDSDVSRATDDAVEDATGEVTDPADVAPPVADAAAEAAERRDLEASPPEEKTAPETPFVLEDRPDPYLAPAGPTRLPRTLAIGPAFGVISRPAQAGAFEYGPAFTWGAQLRVESPEWLGRPVAALRWLGLRLFFTLSDLPVRMGPGALAGSARTSHPDITLLRLGGHLEPTLVVTSGLRAYVGAGLSWNRLWTERLHDDELAAPERSGVALELIATTGLIVDVIPDRLAIDLNLSASGVENERGSLFEDVQAFDANGQRGTLGPFPGFSSALTGLAGLHLVL